LSESLHFPSVVSDIMSSPVVTIDSSKTVNDAAHMMVKKGIGSIVVLVDTKPCGIITERDIIERVVASGKDPSQTTINDIMSSPLICIDKGAPILEAIRRMRDHNIRRLVVMTNGLLEGLITERDVIKAVAVASLTSFRSLLEIRR